MTSKIFGSIVALVLACATATAADIRRVVTALDGSDKADVGRHGGGARQHKRDDRAEDLAGHCVLLCSLPLIPA